MSALSLSLSLTVGLAGHIALTPPTIAPVLIVSAESGSQIANLEWTASNKTSSSGFGYKIELSVDGGAWIEIASGTLFYNDERVGAAGESYSYRITPFNDAGEGPVSNSAGVILPAP